MGRCDTHYGEEAAAACSDCQRWLCQQCLVKIRRRLFMCTHCALVKAGLRARGGRF